MPKTTPVLFILLAAIFLTFAGPGPSRAGQVLPVIDRVTLTPEDPVSLFAFVTVKDEDGLAVENLKEDDFRLIEDGRAVDGPFSVRSFVTTDRTLAYALLFEHRLDMPASLSLVAEGAEGFLRNMGFRYPGAVIGYSGGPRVMSGPGTDIHGASAAIWNAPVEEGPPVMADGLLAALETLESIETPEPPDRRVIVLLTEGRDEGSRFSLEAALAKVAEAGAELYVIHYGDPGEIPPPLNKAARDSGGELFVSRAPDDVGLLLDHTAVRLIAQYVLAYASPDLRLDGRPHTLSVQTANNTAKKTFLVPLVENRNGGAPAVLVLVFCLASLVGFRVWRKNKESKRRELPSG